VVGSAIVQKINNLKEQNLNDQDLVSSLTNYLLDLSGGLNT
jgi:hypothetical protein